jgi:hypothetical protein
LENQQNSLSWTDAERRYNPGQKVVGKVTRVTPFGVFLQVEPEIEGIIYTFELGQGPAAVAGFVPGLEVPVFVKSIDTRRKRLELSLLNQPIPGLLEEFEIPVELRRRKQPDLLPSPPLLTPQDRERAENHGHQTCSTCQRQVQKTWKYCVFCGGSLQNYCPTCGLAQPNIPEAGYCYDCGQRL